MKFESHHKSSQLIVVGVCDGSELLEPGMENWSEKPRF